MSCVARLKYFVSEFLYISVLWSHFLLMLRKMTTSSLTSIVKRTFPKSLSIPGKTDWPCLDHVSVVLIQ